MTYRYTLDKLTLNFDRKINTKAYVENLCPSHIQEGQDNYDPNKSLVLLASRPPCKWG